MTRITLIVGLSAAALMFTGVLLAFLATYAGEDLPDLFNFSVELTVSAMGVVILTIFVELIGHVLWSRRLNDDGRPQ